MPRTLKTKDDSKRYPLNMRTTRETREQLELAAATSGRSLAQEVEYRLERSFDHAEAVTRLDELQHGREVVGLLMLAEQAMIDAGRFAAAEQGKAGLGWLRDPYAYDQAVKAFLEVVEQLRPAGDIPEPGHVVEIPVRNVATGEQKVTRSQLSGQIGGLMAANLIQAVADPQSRPGLADWGAAVRSRLGAIADRIPPLQPWRGSKKKGKKR